MGFTAGVIGVVAALALLFLLKAKDGVERPFARNWMALVGVVMTIMTLFVAGLAAMITNWP